MKSLKLFSGQCSSYSGIGSVSKKPVVALARDDSLSCYRLIFALAAILVGANEASAVDSIILAQGSPMIDPVAVVESPDGLTLYVTDYSANVIFRLPSVGGIPTIFASGAQLVNTRGLAIAPDGSALYVAGWGSGQILRVPIDGGAITVLASGAPLTSPNGIAISPDGTTLYIGDDYAKAVFRLPIGGGMPTVVASGSQFGAGFAGPAGVCVSPDGTILYINSGLSGIFRLSLTVGGGPVQIAAGNYAGAIAIAPDGSKLVVQKWLTGVGTYTGTFGIEFIPLMAGAPALQLVLPAQSAPAYFSLSNDGENLFIADTGYLDRYNSGPVGEPGKIRMLVSLYGTTIVGPPGAQGPAGPAGLTGPQGPVGARGDKGDTGAQGLAGNAGPQGVQGATGPTGPLGPVGAVGLQGIPGHNGDVGPQGMPGAVGPAGQQGPAGLQGAQGNAGAIGPQGPVGPQGPAGPIGIYPIRVIAANATLTISDTVVLIDNPSRTALNINLPAATGARGRFYMLKERTGIGNTNLLPVAGELIEGRPTMLLGVGQGIMIVSDGSGWWIVSKR